MPWWPYTLRFYATMRWRLFKLIWLPHREYPLLDDGEIGIGRWRWRIFSKFSGPRIAEVDGE